MSPAATNLLIEQDPDDIFLARRAFAAAGLKESLRVVHDSAEAIEYLLGENAFDDREMDPFPSLIITDLKLRARDDFDLLDRLQNHPDIRERLAVIAWTGVNVPSLVADACASTPGLVRAKNSKWFDKNRVAISQPAPPQSYSDDVSGAVFSGRLSGQTSALRHMTIRFPNSTQDPVTCEEALEEMLAKGLQIRAIKHEGLELARQDFDRMVKTAADLRAPKSISVSLGIKPEEERFRFGFAAASRPEVA